MNSHHRDAALLLQLCMMYSNMEARRYTPVFHACLIAALNTAQSNTNMWFYLHVMFSTPLSLPLQHPALASVYRERGVQLSKDNTLSYCLPQGVVLEILLQSLAVANDTQHMSHIMLCFKHVQGVLNMPTLQSLRKSTRRVIDNLHALPATSPSKILLNDFEAWVRDTEKSLALNVDDEQDGLPDATNIAELIRKAAIEINGEEGSKTAM